jgi:hypothetical protein
MFRRSAVLLLLTLLASSIPVFSQQSNQSWIEYSSPEGRFSALFPAQPEHETKTNTSPQMKTPYTVQIYSWTDKNVFLGIAYVDYEPEFRLSVDGELEANQNNFLKEAEAKLLSSKKTQFERAPGDTLPALEFSGEASYASFRGVVVVDGHRVYQWTAGTRKDYDGFAVMERFLGSFKLKALTKS